MIKFSTGLRKKLKMIKVGIVYLFGSQVTNDKEKKNDFDLAVVFSYEPDRKKSLSLYSRLYQIFSQEFPKENIDVALLQFSPLGLQFEVIRNGKVLFEVEPEFRMNYEERITRDYFFFEPLQREYERITLQTFS